MWLQVSTVLGAAIPEEREKKGWIEGVAIWIAVLAVTLVGELWCMKDTRQRQGPALFFYCNRMEQLLIPQTNELVLPPPAMVDQRRCCWGVLLVACM